MGFRNALTTVSSLQTAPSGTRIVLSSSVQDEIQFFSGDAVETGPGVLEVGIFSESQGAGYGPAGDRPFVKLFPGGIGSGSPGMCQLNAYGPTRDGVFHAYWEVVGDLVADGDVAMINGQGTSGASATRKDYVDGAKAAPVGWTALPVAAGWTSSASYYAVRHGFFQASIYLTAAAGWSAGFPIATLTAAQRPSTDQHFWCGTYAVDVAASTGVVSVAAANPAANAVLKASLSWPLV